MIALIDITRELDAASQILNPRDANVPSESFARMDDSLEVPTARWLYLSAVSKVQSPTNGTLCAARTWKSPHR